MLDVFTENGKKVTAIGKIEDLFSGRGITESIHTEGNADGIEKTIEVLTRPPPPATRPPAPPIASPVQPSARMTVMTRTEGELCSGAPG